MKKINILSILTLLILVLFASCDNTGVYDAIWNAEVVSNQYVTAVAGPAPNNENHIYYLSRELGLIRYSIATGTTEVLSDNVEYRGATAAGYDETGNYLITYKQNSNTPFTITNISSDSIETNSITSITGISDIRYANGQTFYCINGTYNISVTDENMTSATANSIEPINGSVADIEAGVYSIGNPATEYYISTNGSSYSKASFTEGTDLSKLTLVTATDDHKYLIFNDNSTSSTLLTVYRLLDEGRYTKLRDGISRAFNAYNSNAKAVHTDSAVIIMRGTLLQVIPTDTSVAVPSAQTLSYDNIMAVIPVNESANEYIVFTENAGIHTMTVNGTTVTIN